jgi:hypothetical protein
MVCLCNGHQEDLILILSFGLPGGRLIVLLR